MRLAEAYRSLARPSSALEPSHPLAGISSLCSTELSERLVAKLVHGISDLLSLPRQGSPPFHVELSSTCALHFKSNGLAGIRTQGLRLAKAALYQLSYKPSLNPALNLGNLDLQLVLVCFSACLDPRSRLPPDRWRNQPIQGSARLCANFRR
jgi:hypothetical protein